MGLLDGIKRNFNIGGPKLVVDQPDRYIRADEPKIVVTFTITGSDEATHVDKVVIHLNSLGERDAPRRTIRAVGNQTRHNGGSTTLLYKKTTHTNNDQGWDIPANQVVPFTFEVDLNNPLTETSVHTFLARQQHEKIIGIGNRKGSRLMEIAIVADLPKVMMDPQDVVHLAVDLDI